MTKKCFHRVYKYICIHRRKEVARGFTFTRVLPTENRYRKYVIVINWVIVSVDLCVFGNQRDSTPTQPVNLAKVIDEFIVDYGSRSETNASRR